MGFTNSTPNYGLPQYVADDKPTYLGDFNKAMLDIDTALKNSVDVAGGSQTIAQNANNTATEALNTAQSAETSATSAQSKADNAKTLADNAQKTATNAQTEASEAKTLAQNSNQTATSAKTTSETASSTANSAQSTANSAQSTANSASSKADSALEKINEMKMVVAYSNENPVGLPHGTILQSSVNLNDYDYFEVIYINALGQSRTIHSSGRCETNNTHSVGVACFGFQGGAVPWIRARNFSINSDGNIVCEQGHFLEFTSTGQGNEDNSCLPIQVLAYKLVD